MYGTRMFGNLISRKCVNNKYINIPKETTRTGVICRPTSAMTPKKGRLMVYSKSKFRGLHTVVMATIIAKRLNVMNPNNAYRP